MGLRFSRHLGLPATLDPKQWTDRTASGNPAVMCPSCGGISEVVQPAHVIDREGRVTPSWKCPTETCSFWEWVELEAFAEEVLT